MARTLRRALCAVLTAGGGAGMLVGAAGPATAEEQGLAAGATSRYVLDTSEEVVRARSTIELRNTSPDQRTGGGVYSYYFDAYSLPVPAGAESLRATSEGAALAVSVSGTKDPSTDIARVRFPALRYGQTREIVLTYAIEGAPARSANTTRVGPGYATFVVYGPGDEGSNRVEVVAPSGMTFTSTTDSFTSAANKGRTTYSATENTDGGGLWAVVSLRDPARATERTVRLDDVALTLKSFPDDDTWSDFVAETVTSGLPVLQRLVGERWPGGLQTIREDAAPSLQGFDGWFDPTGEEIVVGERLDDDLIYHELAHAWVSADRFDQRWLYEGLAQAIADRTVSATGGKPERPPTVTRGEPDAVALNTWDGTPGGRSADVDGYAYPASYQVMTALLGELDDAEFAAVVGAGIRGERAYDPPGTVTPSAGRTSWSDWLDLVESRSGVDAARTYSTWVLTADQRKQLEPRARERAAYAALDAADGAWLPPDGLRDAMTSWDFDRARSVRETVAGLGRSATAVQRAAADAGVEVPESVRRSYERAGLPDQYTALRTSLPAAATAITEVARATRTARADRDPVSGLGARILGLEGVSARALGALDSGDTTRARSLARDVSGRAPWALPLGLAVSLVAVAVLIGLVLLGLVLSRRSPRPGLGPVGLLLPARSPSPSPGPSPSPSPRSES